MPHDGGAMQQLCANTDARALALDRVIDLLGDPVRWCKGTAARPLCIINPNDGRARIIGFAYCVTGGLETVIQHMHEDDRVQIRAAITASIREVCGRQHRYGIERWNDDPVTTHSDVMRVLLRSRIRLARGERFPIRAVFLDALSDPKAFWSRSMRGALSALPNY